AWVRAVRPPGRDAPVVAMELLSQRGVALVRSVCQAHSNATERRINYLEGPMSKKLHTEILIGATAEQVWRVLTDLDAYHLWNPFIVEAKGRPAVGRRLSLRMQPIGGSAMTFTPTVLEAEPGRRLRWLGRMILPGILDADHTFTIEPLAAGVRLIQHETFT